MAGEGVNVSTGINEGNAQVFKPVDLSYLDRAIAQQNYEHRAKRAEEKQRGAEFNKGLASLHNLDIFHAHQPYFAQKQKELYEWAKNGNAVKIIKEGDPNTLMDFQKQVADLQTEAAMSKQYGQQAGQLGKELLTKGAEYTPESHEYFQGINQPIDTSKMKKGEGLDFTFHPERVQKEVTPAEMHEVALKNRGTLYPTSFPHKNPDGSVTETTVTQFGPKEALETARYTIKNDPRFIAKANREFAKLKPEEQMLYVNPETKQPDPVEYLAQEQAKQIVVTPKVKQTETQGKSGMTLSFGNGMATNGKYNFVTQDRVKEEPTPTIFDKNKKKIIPYKVISIQRTDAGENKGFFFDDPNREGKKIEVIPKEYEQTQGGAWHLIGVPRGGGKEIRIPEKDVTSDMKAITGVDLNEIIQGEGNTKETKVAGSKAVPQNLIARKTKNGRVALFDANKKFVRWQ